MLPLLDGLDEVKPELQSTCIVRINQWLQGHCRPLFIVVCSRSHEYAIQQTELNLNGAVLLEALTDEQIEAYLAAINRIDLWQTLQQDVTLLDLVRTPLLLNITILAYGELFLHKWQTLTTTKQRLDHLLDAYVQRMLQRNLTSRAYKTLNPPEAGQTQFWLIFLAQQLQRESQTDFEVAGMRLDWSLTLTNKQKRSARLFIVLFCMLFGVQFGILVRVLSGSLSEALFFGLLFGSFSALFLGLFFQRVNRNLVALTRKAYDEGLKHTSSWSYRKKTKRYRISLLILGLLGLGLLVIGIIAFKTDVVAFVLLFVYMVLIPWTPEFAANFSLFRDGYIPWNYTRFLDYCVERLLIQRVGQRYQFIHKLLQDYFAAMPLDSVSLSSQSRRVSRR